jgi:hypothetical protein
MVRKISLAQCVIQGQVALTIWCVTHDPNSLGYGGGPKVCGHHKEIPMAEAFELFGAETSLSELSVTCTVCGGRQYDARGSLAPEPDRWTG